MFSLLFFGVSSSTFAIYIKTAVLCCFCNKKATADKCSVVANKKSWKTSIVFQLFAYDFLILFCVVSNGRFDKRLCALPVR